MSRPGPFRWRARKGQGRHWGVPVLMGVMLATAWWLVVYVPAAMSGWTGPHFGWDIHHYLIATQAWLQTGSPYDPSLVNSRFDSSAWAFMHPPVAMLLFVPFLFLPLALWWAIPIGIVAWSLWTWKPSPWAWALMIFLWSWPLSLEVLFMGNSTMWVTAFVAAGLRFGWPLALLVVKPTLLPLTIVRARDPRMWALLGVVGLLCLPFGALWLDWFAIVRNFQGPPWYNLFNLPLILSPVVAWLGSGASRHRARARLVGIGGGEPHDLELGYVVAD